MHLLGEFELCGWDAIHGLQEYLNNVRNSLCLSNVCLSSVKRTMCVTEVVLFSVQLPLGGQGHQNGLT